MDEANGMQLKSESAVLKSTVYTEFMSEWLQPWSVQAGFP